MKKIIFILTCLSTLGGHLAAQNPKWFKKAAKAQISIVTMNEKGGRTMREDQAAAFSSTRTEQL